MITSKWGIGVRVHSQRGLMEVLCPFQIKFDPRTADISFPEYLFGILTKYGKNLALVQYETGNKWLYKDIKIWVEHSMTLLRQQGIGSGSRVGVALLNYPQTIILQLACGCMGVTCVMLSPLYTVDEIWHQVDLSETTHVITEEQFVQKIEDVRKKTMARGNPRFKKIVDFTDVVQTPTIQPSDIGAEEMNTQEMSSGQSQTFMVFFSSGTTGLPKAVDISHRSFVINMQQMSAPYLHPPTAKDRMLLQLPLQHIYGTLVAYYALFNGCTAVTLEKYKLDLFLAAIQEYKISVLHCIPPQVNQLANDNLVSQFDLSSLTSITSAGAPLGPEVGDQCRQRLHLQDMRQLFGMTELGTVSLWSRFGCVDVASIGVPLPGTICKIVHPDKRHLMQPGEMGELCIKGPQVFFKYYKNAKSTAEMLDKEGFLKTGDMAFYTVEGCMYIVDRIKDIIKYKNNQVSPSELEKILREYPAVQDCGVVGRQDQVAGEVPAAFIVKEPNNAMLQAQEIRAFVRGRVAPSKELRGGIFFVNEIPRGVSGKINRRLLRGFWDRKESKANLLADPNGTHDVASGKSTDKKPGNRLQSGGKGDKVLNRNDSTSTIGSTPAARTPRRIIRNNSKP